MPNESLIPKRPEYYVQTGSMFDNPYGVPHREIVQYILENPPEVVAQVVFGKYVESSGLVFTGELIQAMIDRSLLRVNSQSWTDKESAALAQTETWRGRDSRQDRRGKRWHTGIDFARKKDYTVIFTIDTHTMPARVVHYRRLNRVPWETIYREVGRTVSVFGPSALGDSTGMGGDVVMDALESRSYCPKHDRTFLVGDGGVCPRDGYNGVRCLTGDYVRLSCVESYEFSGARKVQLIEHLRNILSVGYVLGEEGEFGWLRTPPIVQLEEEMAFYAWDDKDLETDCLMGLALAVWHGMEEPVGAISNASTMGA